MSRKDCLEKIKKLPLLPGVYIMKDKDKKIIYVGKAKKLKNRVSQYFVGHHLPKVEKMVEQIDDFDYTVAPSETEALILENNLIKLHRPKYNILLKDDKTYPYLALDETEEYPRLMLCRKREKDGKIYFGPFASGTTVRNIKRQTEQLFGLVTCRPKIGTRPCLSYQIGHCCGVCTGRVSKEEYNERVGQALTFLKGDYKKTLRQMRAEMEACAERMEFEKAAALRDRIRSIERLGDGQIMVLSPDMDEDVFGVAELGDKRCISVLNVREGRLCRQERFFLDESCEQNELESFLQQYYDLSEIPPRIVYDGENEIDPLFFEWLSSERGSKVSAVCPQKGVQKEVLALAVKNALEGLEMRRSLKDKANRASVSLAEFLGLSDPPRRIEMYDISNFGEDAMVGGMIVWQDGGLKKSLYRRFQIKNQSGIDDYSATREVLSRRLENYRQGEKGFETAPDIILMDGGKGHISAVADLVEEYLPNCVLYGLSKDSRHRTSALVTEDGRQIGLAGTPYFFSFFSKLQEEVHRYTIDYMHKRKSMDMTRSELKGIPGLGEKRIRILYDHFKTLSAIRTAGMTELMAVPGLPQNAALALYQHFHKEDEQ